MSALQRALSGDIDVDLRDLLCETEEQLQVMVRELGTEAADMKSREETKQESVELSGHASKMVARWRRATSIASEADTLIYAEREKRRQLVDRLLVLTQDKETELLHLSFINKNLSMEIERLEKLLFGAVQKLQTG